jgi:probable HAF family extracellular repeat protein
MKRPDKLSRWSALLMSPIAALVLASCRDPITPTQVIVTPPPVDTVATLPRRDKQAFIYTPGEGVVAIPNLPGATESQALAVNDDGEVVGIAMINRQPHPFFWSKDRGLIEIKGKSDSLSPYYASAINANGQVAGSANSPGGNVHAFRWSLSEGLIDLGIPDGSLHSFGSGINRAGDVVGEIWSHDGIRAFHWTEKDGFADPGSLPVDRLSRAIGINDGGVTVGSSIPFGDTYGDDPNGVMVWAASGERTDIIKCFTSDCYAQANGISNDGVIVGYNNYRAFRWDQAAGLVYLTGTLTMGMSTANAINDLGQITGSGYIALAGTNEIEHALLWSGTNNPVSIGELTGYGRSAGTGINNRGQIVGYDY